MNYGPHKNGLKPPSLFCAAHAQPIAHPCPLTVINVEPHRHYKWNGIGFVWRSDSKKALKDVVENAVASGGYCHFLLSIIILRYLLISTIFIGNKWSKWK